MSAPSPSSPSRALVLRAVVFGLAAGALACAASPEQSAEAERQSAPPPSDIPSEPSAEPMDAPAEAAAAEESAPGLDDFERRLASNRAELSRLGVRFADPDPDPDAAAAADAEPESELDLDAAEELEAAPSPSAGGGSPAKPSTKSKSKSTSTSSKGKGKGSSGRASASPDAKEAPEQAKAVQGPPIATELEDAAGRCESICSLGQVTCELSDSICALAERHTDEDDYQSACERAVGDCQVAKEACDGCED
ncbi:hypothetical protein G6O69_13765 [Pseudenhygromyxa sp. WMMC2535]|uniref:hypothetical protein n=1 Tax=Pseudenhygromyxa sp. WMMC2535 TaxID=2712867 RepID=UPI0015525D8F|nr:hypothetical protein [Pseudenhygromyxa sp. WMMC2535]NVB38904.1 hypothetical protein [Pseudenhygromyxa sp. WMMC2535]